MFTDDYVIQGTRIVSLETFFDEISCVLVPDAKWGRNLDAFNDILSGGFGTPEGGFVLRWSHAAESKIHLSYAETIRQLKVRLEKCHPESRSYIRQQLHLAETNQGPTVFDWLVEIIHAHGIDGSDSQDGVVLILE